MLLGSIQKTILCFPWGLLVVFPTLAPHADLRMSISFSSRSADFFLIVYSVIVLLPHILPSGQVTIT